MKEEISDIIDNLRDKVYKSFKSAEEILSYVDKNRVSYIIYIVGHNEVEDRVMTYFGPSEEWDEQHSEIDGYWYEQFAVYEYEEDEVIDYIMDYYSDVDNLIDDFLYAVKNNKDWVEKYYSGDEKAVEVYMSESDQISIALSKYSDSLDEASLIEIVFS